MAIVKAKAYYNFGFSTIKNGNINFIDDDTIVFPSGTCCVFQNIVDNVQQTINSGSGSTAITAMAVSPNKKYVAFTEWEEGTSPLLLIYDTSTYRRKTTLSQNIFINSTYDDLTFSSNSKLLAAIAAGFQEFHLFVWTWDRSQLVGNYQLANEMPVDSMFYSVSFCPSGNEVMSVIGSNYQQVFLLHDFVISPENDAIEPPIQAPSQGASDSEVRIYCNFLCQAWFGADVIILGTDDNLLLILEDDGVVQDIKVCTVDEEGLDSHERSEDLSVYSIVADEKGFWCSCGKVALHYFEKSESEDEQQFVKLRELKMIIRMTRDEILTDMWSSNAYFKCICADPSFKTITVVSDSGQVFSCDIPSDSKWFAEVNFTRVVPNVHTDIITGMDVCVRKPYIATCSMDKSIKIWNYLNFRLQVSKLFDEPLLSLSLHPRGHILLVGFTTCLKLLNIFSDDIQSFRVFPIAPCIVCRFAHEGHMFAVARLNIVEIYSSITFQLVSLFKTHLDMVRSMCWTDNDARIVSAGRDGAIYEWEVLTAKRYSESVVKGCSYSSVLLDGKSIYAIGSDQLIKEIADSMIITSVACDTTEMTQITMTHSGRAMFIGLVDGFIRSMRFPLADPPDWVELQGHCGAIRGLKVTCDDEFLVSVAEDASIIVWKILDRAIIGQSKIEKPYTMEILVLPPDIEKKDTTIKGLELRVEELQSEIPYQVLQKDISYNESLSSKMHQFFAEMEILKEENLSLSKEQKSLEESFLKSIAKLQKKYLDINEGIETQNKQVLMTEYGKYQELKDKDTRMNKEYHRKLEELDRKIDLATSKLLQAIELKNLKPPPIKYDFSKEWEEMKRQIEEDNDTRIMEFIGVSQDKLNALKSQTSLLKVENYTIKKNIIFLKKGVDENVLHVSKQQNEIEKLQANLESLKTLFETLKKSVLEKEKRINEKEEVMHDLRKLNQSLEKSEAILDFRIQELKKHLELKKTESQNLKYSIESMEEELMKMRDATCYLEEMNYKITDKVKVDTQKKKRVKRELLQAKTNYVKLRNGIYDCTGLIHKNEELKKKVKALLDSTYVVGKEVVEQDQMDNSSLCDFNAQRAHLKLMVIKTKKQMKEQKLLQERKELNNMQKNSQHMNELESLKAGLKKGREQLKLLYTQLYIRRPDISAKQIQEMVMKAIPDFRLLGQVDELTRTIELNTQLISDLEMENCLLTADLNKNIQKHFNETSGK